MTASGGAADERRTIVSIDDVSFSYGDTKVLNELHFSIGKRDFVGLIGPNGAGKSTLLKMLVGLLKPESGAISLFGEPIGRFRAWERIGYVPQKNAFNPLFPATVREVVVSGFYGRKQMYRRLTKAELTRGGEVMAEMGIEALADRKIGQLSGGQQQRAFLARALVNRPELLILDEPTVGIDAETQARFFQLIRDMHEKESMAFIMVSHDLEMMRSYLGDRPQVESGGLQFFVRQARSAVLAR